MALAEMEISWRKWVQTNFTALVLLHIVVLSLAATVILMHEDAISDKYVTWLEGFTEAAMTSLALSLRGAGTVSGTPATNSGLVITTPGTVTTTQEITTHDTGSGTNT